MLYILILKLSIVLKYNFHDFYLYTLKPVLSICIFLVFVPVVISQYIRIHAFSELEDETVPYRREYAYYQECVTGREYFKETRMLGAYRYFSRPIRETIEKINGRAWKCYGKMAGLEILMRFITLLGYVGVLLLLVYYVINGSISVGAFAAVFSSVAVMFDMIESAVGQQLGGAFEKMDMVANYMKFLDMEEMRGERSRKKHVGKAFDRIIQTCSGRSPYWSGKYQKYEDAELSTKNIGSISKLSKVQNDSGR